MTKFNFRLLLCISVLVNIIGALYEFLFPDEVLSKVQKYAIEIEPKTVFDSMSPEILITVFVASLCVYAVSIVGLFLFKNWARHLYVSFILLTIPLYLTTGLNIYSPIPMLLSSLSCYLEGAIITLSYFSLDHVFKEK